MLGAMPEHAGSICPSHAQKCYVRTNERTQLTYAVKAKDSHLTFLNARVGLWISRLSSLGVA